MSGSVTGRAVYQTAEQAKEAGEKFMREYPREGYDSRYSVWQDQTDGVWHLVTHRYASCD